MTIDPIAEIRTDFKEKFGIPRQSGLVKNARGYIVFKPEYRQPEAFKGLDGYSHIWLIWDFSKSHRDEFAATVAPPRLKGKEKMGVFATRSPFRPNNLGLSVVKLEEIKEDEKDGIVLVVSGVDLLDGTPIYDIKPYIPYADKIEDANGGFTDEVPFDRLDVTDPDGLLDKIDEDIANDLKELISLDPRTSYIDDEERIWGMAYGGYNIRFIIKNETAKVVEIEKLTG